MLEDPIIPPNILDLKHDHELLGLAANGMLVLGNYTLQIDNITCIKNDMKDGIGYYNSDAKVFDTTNPTLEKTLQAQGAPIQILKSFLEELMLISERNSLIIQL